MKAAGKGWSSGATVDGADAIPADRLFVLETLDRVNHLASDLSFDETLEQVGMRSRLLGTDRGGCHHIVRISTGNSWARVSCSK